MFKQFSTANDKWQGKVFISYNHLLGILTLTKKEVETVETMCRLYSDLVKSDIQTHTVCGPLHGQAH